MVMSSSEISQLTAQSQAMGMSQMQHAAMISQQAGGGAGPGSTMGENVAGAAINRIGAVASPVIGGAMALGGLDPFSMAMKGGMAGFARGGVMGAMGGGMLAGGAVALPMMAAQYAGGQMLTGMQQQQQLNTAMRQSFNFQNRFGGQGFTGSELSTIGQQFRGMSMQRGPGGETTSFEELSRLASNMGRMGMAQNVRSVEEFQDQFSKMVKQVKKVAEAMSTSLEEAQEMMVGMRNVGVFSNQGQVAGDVRGMALAGNMSTSEVLRSMGTGSRISRMIGGRGRAGAMAGLQAAGMVGIGQQIGTLSEEDIYNVTGQTGAEGRHAMAAGIMQSSAAFLKSSLGRRVVASVAGKGGTINQEAMEEYMYGGVGTGRTMQLAHQNLAKIGRADFIKNEGRLRGAALGANPLIGIQAMAGWLEQRGMSADDDRTRIFMQRRMKGTSMEQIDQMLKLVRDLPRMQQAIATSGERAEFGARVQQEKSRQGIKGLKRKFEQARDEVQGTLRQVGADFYMNMSDEIEQFVNRMTGEVVTQVAKDLPQLSRDVFKGGAIGQHALDRIGMGRDRAWMSDAASWTQGQMGAIRGTGNIGMRSALYRSGDLQRLSRAGYGITAGSDEAVSRQIAENRRLSQMFTSGGRMSDEEAAMFKQIGGGMKEELLAAASTGRLAGGGKAMMQSIVARMQEAPLGSRRRQLAEDLSRKLASGSKRDMRLVALATGQIMREAGLGEMVQEHGSMPGLQAIFGRSGYSTEREQHEAIGEAVFGTIGVGGGRERVEEARTGANIAGGTAGAVAGSIPGLGIVEGITGLFDKKGRGYFARKAEEAAMEYQTGGVQGRGERGTAASLGRMGDEARREAGRLMMTDEYLEDARTAAFGNAEANKDLRERMMKENTSILKGLEKQGKTIADLKGIQRGKFEANRSLIAGSKMREVLEREGMTIGQLETDTSERGKALKEEIRKIVGTASWDETLSLAKAPIAAALEGSRRERQQVLQAVGKRGAEASLAGARTGFIEMGEGGEDRLSAEVRAQMTAKGGAGQAGVEAAEAIAASISATSTITGAGGEREEDLFEKGRSEHLKAMEKISSMSVSQKRAFAKTLRGRGGTDEYRQAAMAQATIQERLSKAKGKKGGQALAVAQSLGINMSAEDIEGMTPAQAAEEIAKRSGLKETERETLREQVATTLKQAKEGKLGAAAKGLYEGQGAGLVQKAAQKQQEEQLAQKSPEFRVLRGIGKSLDALPGKIADAMSGKPITVKGTVNTIESGDAGKGDKKPSCFPGDVLVLMADGSSKPIRDVKPGDEVVSMDVDTGLPSTDVVYAAESHLLATDIVKVAGVPMTPNHPVWVNGVWLTADKIQVGDALRQLDTPDGDLRTEYVMEVYRMTRDVFLADGGDRIVYNIRMVSGDTYVAGGLLVNQECG